MKIDHVLFVGTFKNVIKSYSKKFSIIYLGNEFCQNLIPPEEDIKKTIDFCERKNLGFVLVTPLLLEEGRTTLSEKMKRLPPGTEVVFNDWGALNIIKTLGHVPVMGRTLLKVRRDPEIAIENAGESFYKDCNITDASFRFFLRGQNIERVEIDNIEQGYRLKQKEIKTSLYYPFVFIATGRRCIYRWVKEGKMFIDGCKIRYCAQNNLKANMNETNKEIYIKGNTHFYLNNKKPSEKNRSDYNVDRFVFCPDSV